MARKPRKGPAPGYRVHQNGMQQVIEKQARDKKPRTVEQKARVHAQVLLKDTRPQEDIMRAARLHAHRGQHVKDKLIGGKPKEAARKGKA